MARKYSPGGAVPEVLGELARFLRTELNKIADAIVEDFIKYHAEPGKVKDGMVRYADGTDWDPGNGEGLYLRESGGEWAKLAKATRVTLATTVTGYASDPAVSITVTKIDRVVNISIPTFTGTSDATTKATADALAAAYRPAAVVNIPILAIDNGGARVVGTAEVGTDGIITFRPTTVAATVWTASGAATVARADHSYPV